MTPPTRSAVARAAGAACMIAFGLLAPVAEAVAQNPSLHFSRLGARDGLSQASVMSLAQDSLGFVWVGTQDGLNRFDGYEFKVFRNDPGDPGSLANAFVNNLEVDRDGTLQSSSRATWRATDSCHRSW